MRCIVIALTLALLCSACARPAPVAQAVTPEPLPTYTPYPTLVPPSPYPTYTAYPTYTPYPKPTTPPTITPTPAPTETPKPKLASSLWDMTPVQLSIIWDGLTHAQRSEYAKELVGKVIRWRAEIVDVDEDVNVLFRGEPFKSMIFAPAVQVPQADLTKYSKSQVVTIEATITGAKEGLLSDVLELQLDTVTIIE